MLWHVVNILSHSFTIFLFWKRFFSFQSCFVSVQLLFGLQTVFRCLILFLFSFQLGHFGRLMAGRGLKDKLKKELDVDSIEDWSVVSLIYINSLPFVSSWCWKINFGCHLSSEGQSWERWMNSVSLF